MHVELTMGDVIFLLDTFKVINNVLDDGRHEEVQELVDQCEKLLNEAVTSEGNIEKYFGEAIEDLRWEIYEQT